MARLPASCGIGHRPQALVPHDALIEPRWSLDAAHRRPRRPHRRTVPAMLPLIPRTGLGEAARAPSRASEETDFARPLSPGAELPTFFDQRIRRTYKHEKLSI